MKGMWWHGKGFPRLKNYVREAVRAETEVIGMVFIDQNRLLMDFLRRIIPKEVLLDTGAMVGALTPAIDAQMADRLVHAQRGNTR